MLFVGLFWFITKGIDYLSRGGQMLLQSLVKDKEKSTGSARGIRPQDILSSLSRKDEKKINGLELLYNEESYENEDYY